MSAEIIKLDDHREKEISDEQLTRLIFGPVVEVHLGEFDPKATAEKVVNKELEAIGKHFQELSDCIDKVFQKGDGE